MKIELTRRQAENRLDIRFSTADDAAASDLADALAVAPVRGSQVVHIDSLERILDAIEELNRRGYTAVKTNETESIIECELSKTEDPKVKTAREEVDEIRAAAKERKRDM